MKQFTIAALIVLSAGAASASPFGYQQQVGSSEFDPRISERPAVAATPFAASNFNPSLLALYENVDIDGSAELEYTGHIVPSINPVPSGYEQFMNSDTNIS